MSLGYAIDGAGIFLLQQLPTFYCGFLMNFNPFDSHSNDEESEVYINAEDIGEQEIDSISRRSSSSGDDALEMELEDKLADNDKDKNEFSSDTELEDVYEQNQKIIDLLEKINNKM